MRLAAGAQIGHYILNYHLGTGGMAEVWAATHTILRVQVALKVLFSNNPVLQNRLLREGRTQAALDHPNILPVRDIIDVDGAPGLILPLIRGPSLDKLLQKYRPALHETVALFRAIVEGVNHAHHFGLIHRDLKPGNILLEERRGRIIPRVADFGLVKIVEEPGQTKSNAMMGTLAYAAPEQLLDASKVDHRADLFSLGVILVELLTGKRPFQGRSLQELLNAYPEKPDLNGIPNAFEPLCIDLLAIEPAHRLSDCATLLETLNGIHPPVALALGLASEVARAVQQGVFHQTEADSSVTGSETREMSFTSLESLSSAEHPSPPRHNLPTEVDAFIGRKAALRTLAQRLQSSRLVNILGAGGIGKTRLALQFARQHLSDYPGGVFFCDFSEAKTLEGLVSVVSQAMSVPLGKGDHLQQLGHAIAGRHRCLLIFDNFEQIVEYGAETMGAWLKRAKDVRVVVTSRVLLELEGEQPLRLDPLNEDDAVALFVTRAKGKKSNFALTHQNRDAIHQLVRLLDGLPLAIELATARVSVMTPAKILKRMAQRFKLLSYGRGDTSQRQATLYAAIDWSWELLADWEQAAFAQCGIFEDGFTLEAAEAVIDLDAFEKSIWPIDAVQSLVDKSLLRPMGENRLGEKRFGMLMSIQEYAAGKLGQIDSETVEATRRRHALFYAQFGEAEALEALKSGEGVSRWWVLQAEVDNLLAAHRFAVQNKTVGATVQLALALFAVAERQQPTIAFNALKSTLALVDVGTHNPSITAQVHTRLGNLHADQGHRAEAATHYKRALSIAREIGHRPREGEVLMGLGVLHYRQGQMKNAEMHFKNALSIYQEIGNKHAEGMILNNLGNMHNDHGDTAKAEAHYKRALSIANEIGNQRSEAHALTNLGILYMRQGRIKEAAARYKNALSIHQEVGNRRSEGNVLTNLGILLYDQGQFAEAEDRYRRALRIHQEVGNRSAEGITLANLGRLCCLRGHLAEAEARYKHALSIYQEVGNKPAEGSIQCSLGVLHWSQGQMPKAQDHYKRALSIHQEVGNRRSEAVVLTNLGVLLTNQGQTEEAEDHYKRALCITREVGDRRSEGIALANLGNLCMNQGQMAEAEDYCRHALNIGREFGIRVLEGSVLGTLGLVETLGGRLEAGVARLKEGEALLRDVNDPLELSKLLCRRAQAEHFANNPQAAARAFDEAKQIAKDLNIKTGTELAKQIAQTQTIVDDN